MRPRTQSAAITNDQLQPARISGFLNRVRMFDSCRGHSLVVAIPTLSRVLLCTAADTRHSHAVNDGLGGNGLEPALEHTEAVLPDVRVTEVDTDHCQ